MCPRHVRNVLSPQLFSPSLRHRLSLLLGAAAGQSWGRMTAMTTIKAGIAICTAAMITVTTATTTVGGTCARPSLLCHQRSPLNAQQCTLESMQVLRRHRAYLLLLLILHLLILHLLVLLTQRRPKFGLAKSTFASTAVGSALVAVAFGVADANCRARAIAVMYPWLPINPSPTQGCAGLFACSPVLASARMRAHVRAYRIALTATSTSTPVASRVRSACSNAKFVVVVRRRTNFSSNQAPRRQEFVWLPAEPVRRARRPAGEPAQEPARELAREPAQQPAREPVPVATALAAATAAIAAAASAATHQQRPPPLALQETERLDGDDILEMWDDDESPSPPAIFSPTASPMPPTTASPMCVLPQINAPFAACDCQRPHAATTHMQPDLHTSSARPPTQHHTRGPVTQVGSCA